ncbi:MAG: dihydrodipicolinate synthase family protein, partial [Oscillospiraceae bacterium]
EEKIKLVRLTVEHIAPGRPVIAGTGMESLKETIRFTNLCADLGATAALVLTPSYYDSSMTSPALIEFFSTLADQSKIPVMIYNVPKYTHVNIKADAVEALSRHPNIAGMKDSTGDVPQLATFKRVADPDFQLLVGTAAAWYPALTLGVEAGILALANCSPDACIAVQEAFEAGDWARSRDLYQAICPLNAAVTGTYGIPGLKRACNVLGYRGGFVRRPMLERSAADMAQVESIVATTLEKLKKLG